MEIILSLVTSITVVLITAIIATITEYSDWSAKKLLIFIGVTVGISLCIFMGWNQFINYKNDPKNKQVEIKKVISNNFGNNYFKNIMCRITIKESVSWSITMDNTKYNYYTDLEKCKEK